MRRPLLLRRLGLVVAGLVLAGGPARADTLRLKPPEFGGDRPPGTIRRVIQPFGPWTLVCDEDLPRKKRVCNVSQTYLDQAGATAFSWSLAATRGGAPVMVLRAPNPGGDPRIVTVAVDGDAEPAAVALTTCDAATCLGFWPLGPAFQRQLKAGTGTVRVALGKAEDTTLDAPLAPLAAALAAIQ